MTREEAIEATERVKEIIEECTEYGNEVCCVTSNEADALNMAIKALEMQKKLAEFRGMDICHWDEDYDYEENNISEYEMEASVDDFLIDEAKEEPCEDEVKIHTLKIQPKYFNAVLSGAKNFELRKDDRNYQVGDLITLREYENEAYTGREIKNLTINYILRDCPEFGLKDGYCILGF